MIKLKFATLDEERKIVKKFTPKQWAKAVLNEWLYRMNCCGVEIEGENWEASAEDMGKAAEALDKYVNSIRKKLDLYSNKNHLCTQEDLESDKE